jgi:pimeloyl-ACP methyl ester carboxylesterase
VTIRDRFITARGIRFHYLEGGDPSNTATPVFYVPGYLADAEWFRLEMVALEPRYTLSISMRGRGKTDAPIDGYGFEDHVADLEAVLEAIDLQPLCLVAFSRGVSYALAYALRHLDHIKGVIIQDSDPCYYRLTEQWLNQVRKQMSHVPEHVVQGIYRDSADVDLWDRLQGIACPVMVMRGTNSHLTEENAERYKQVLPEAEVVVMEEAGHLLWERNYEEFFGHLERFLLSLDRK